MPDLLTDEIRTQVIARELHGLQAACFRSTVRQAVNGHRDGDECPDQPGASYATFRASLLAGQARVMARWPKLVEALPGRPESSVEGAE